MQVLHGSWQPITRRFILWGEDAERAPVYRKGRRGDIAPHPFQTEPEMWQRLLAILAPDVSPYETTVTVWLPGVEKQVEPSPEARAAGAWPLDVDRPELLAWQVDGVMLDPVDALTVLVSLGSTRRDVTLGSDLVFWRQAGLLALNSLAEGRYIPALRRQGSTMLARWQARADPGAFFSLAATMPALARAMIDEADDAYHPRALLNDFLNAVVDANVRAMASASRTIPKNVKHPWLKALLSEEARLPGGAARHQKLFEAWQTWQESVSDGGDFRVAFRLSEPHTDFTDHMWRLDYLLQALDDPSLLVTAETVWSARGNLTVLERHFAQPQASLLAALGLAGRVFPPLERSLFEQAPVGVDLTTEEAHQFLTEAVLPLEANGFAVLVPNWWGRRAQLRARAKLEGEPHTPTGHLSQKTLVSYRWELALGDQAITRDEFEQLVALKQPLVQLRGEWVALDPDQIEAARRFFDQAEEAGGLEGEMGLLDALRWMVAPETPFGEGQGAEDDNALPVDAPEIEGWLSEALASLRQPDGAHIPELPSGLAADLRPYQARGFGWLASMAQMGLGACLADDMGLGKTVQTITLWLHQREREGVSAPALLVCPTSVVGNWGREIERFAPGLRVYVHQGGDRLRDEAFAELAAKVDVVLTSYALLHRDEATLKGVHWSSVVLDEAQNIKNPSTKQAQAARSLSADLRLALTGTPVENRLSELWSIMQFLNPGYLGSQKAFKQRFATPIERYRNEAASGALKQLTAPFILRRVKTDPKVIQDLPEKLENKTYCNLTAEQATLYEAAVREEMALIEDAASEQARRGSILRMLTRLKQICNHPAQFLQEGQDSPLAERSGKLDRLLDMLSEVRAVDECALIFTQYAQMGRRLRAYLREELVDEVLFLHGGTPGDERDEMVRRFQAASGPPLFVLSLKAGGTGLNLTRANHVFHYDRWYNPAVENQATDRAYRIGQVKTVEVHKFITLGTLEEHIDNLITHKQALAESIIGTEETWLTELNDADLHDLVRLRQG